MIGYNNRGQYKKSTQAHMLTPTAEASGLWKNLTFFLAFPAIGVVAYTSFSAPHPQPPAFVPYEHLRIRRKVCTAIYITCMHGDAYDTLQAFPWGVESLFHNDHVNPLPDGYHTHGAHH